MREAFLILKRYGFKYKVYLSLNIIFNIFAAVFGAFSILAIKPLLEVIFEPAQVIVQNYVEVNFSLIPWNIPTDELKLNLNIWLGKLMQEQGGIRALTIVGLFVLASMFIKNLCTFLAGFNMIKIRNHVVKDIRNALYSKIVSLPIGYFNEERKGDIISRATTDIIEVETSIIYSLNMIFKNPLLITVYVSLMLVMSWKLTVFAFIMLPIAGLIIGIIGKTLRKQSLKAQGMMGEILSWIEETLGGLRIVKAFNAEEKMGTKQKEQNNRYRRVMDLMLTRNQLASPLSEFLGTIVFIVVMIYGGSLILKGESSMVSSDFLVYLGLFYSIINPAKGFSTAYYRVQKGLASMDRIDDVLNTKSNIEVIASPLKLKEFNNSIEYKNVWFKYVDDYVLEDVNISIKKGETVALVGQSGSGKSTMADLLPRFYDVNKGSIEIDGVNIKDMYPDKLRGYMGIVNQEAILFNDTIYNNITFGVDSATPEEVEQAAKIANAHEFIIQTEDAYQTNIGDRGNRLSGGQRQRISIARAVLTNPPIMILDEATSSLDTESEKLVQEALNKLMSERTSLVIAHRLSTIRNADRIYVLRDGKIIESGNYNMLLTQGGEFKKLHDIQFG